MKRSWRDYVADVLASIQEAVRRQYPGVPWKRMTGMRDKLIHEYSGVDLEIVWGVVRTELPPVKPVVEQILQGLEAG